MRATVKSKVETDTSLITLAPQIYPMDTPFLPHFSISAYMPNQLRLINPLISTVPLDLTLICLTLHS